MAPGDRFQRSVSVPNTVASSLSTIRASAVLTDATTTTRPLLMHSLSCMNYNEGVSDDVPININLLNKVHDLSTNAAAQLGECIEHMVSLMQIQANLDDAVTLLPELTFLVKSTILNNNTINFARGILNKARTLLRSSQYNQQSVFVSKCINIVMQIQRCVNQAGTVFHEGSTPQQQQNCSGVIINTPELALAACIVVKAYLTSL